MKSVWALEIGREAQEDVLVLTLRGRLGTESAGNLIDAVVGALDGGKGCRSVLVDLEGVDYMSSAGLMAVDAVAGRTRAAGGALVLCHACDPVRLVLEFGGLLGDVPLAATRAEGLDLLRRGRG